jgi:carbamate kinase
VRAARKAAASGPIVVSIGGNALAPDGDASKTAAQLSRAYEAAGELVRIISGGRLVAITHGNGPQVGQILLREEADNPSGAITALDVYNAETQGAIGYMLVQALGNVMASAGIDRSVLAVVTRVVVSLVDPAFLAPTKPVGPFYTEAEAQALRERTGWQMVADSGRGWRRVVPSPRPLAIVEGKVIADLVRAGVVAVCGGGGGIPVARRADGHLEGVPAVIDKDYASALIAREIGATVMVMATQVERISLNFGTEHEKPIASIDAETAELHLRSGQFPPGSMGPKVEAGLQFLRSGGRAAIITDVRHLVASLAGRSGTWIHS